MRHTYCKAMIVAAVISVTGCDLTLLPEDTVTPENYFKSETDLQLWTNRFYTLLDDPNTAPRMNADDMVDKIMGDVISGTRLPSDDADGDNEWNWEMLRSINYYFAHSDQCSDEDARYEYDGVAYFFRAYFYWEKVLRYGDVPWYDMVLGSDDDELLKKPREDRGVIMDHIMSDLDSATVRLSSEKSVSRVTKWAALAMKSRIALFEGTWRKYRSMDDADKYLTAAAEAAKAVMDGSGYTLYNTGDEPYRDLFNSDDAKSEEVILARMYNFEGLNLAHSLQFNLRNDSQGFTKRFMNHYLMADGTRFTDKDGYNTMFYTEEVADRDPRLSQTVLCPGYKVKGETSVTANDLNSYTGYEPIKGASDASHSGASKSTSDYCLIRLAEVYLNYAEAKAEMGTLEQSDIDISVNKIRERAKMPSLDMAWANSNPDPFLKSCYPNVTVSDNTGVILEIRRERTVELCLEGFRQWDMFRWKEGAQMVNETNPYYGMYIPGVGLYDMDGDGKNDLEIYSDTQQSAASDGLTVIHIGSEFVLSEGTSGYIVAWSNVTYTWNEERDYLWPIPADQRVLTGGLLTQNPGWNDGYDF